MEPTEVKGPQVMVEAAAILLAKGDDKSTPVKEPKCFIYIDSITGNTMAVNGIGKPVLMKEKAK